MDGQLEALRQDIGSVKDEIAKTRQDLAAAEQARNNEDKRVLLDLLLNLSKLLLCREEQQTILLRRQAPSKHVFSFYMLACPCSHHVPLYSVNDSILWVLLLHMIQKGFLPRLS